MARGFKRVVVTGSLAFDNIMSMPGRFKDHIMPDKVHMLNVSFIMDDFHKEFGGTGGNIAYSLSLLGAPVLLVGSGGNDFAPYMDHLRSLNGVDVAGLRLHEDISTAQGFVMTDKDDNQIWGFYAGAMNRESEISLKGMIGGGDMVVIGPNDPKGMVKYVKEVIELEVPYMFDPAFNIPHFSNEDLARAINGCLILVGNDYEIELMRRTLRWTEEEFFTQDRIVITTMGAEGSVVRQGAQEWRVPAAKVKDVADPTGAGDGYRSGFMAGYFKGFDLEVCGQMGAVSAVYSVEKFGTQLHNYTKAEFEARFGENFPEGIKLS